MHLFSTAHHNLQRHPPRGLLFDMDGTILDTRPYHMAAWRKLVGRLGFSQWHYELAETGFGKTNWLIFREWFGPHADTSNWDALSQEKEIYFREYIHGHAVARPGFYDLLRWARRHGVRIALATSGPRENAEFLLRELKATHWFDAIVFGDASIPSKPHPEPFLRAARRLGLSPQQCLGFEDSHHGFWSVLRAQMPLIGIAERPQDLIKIRRWTGHVYRDFRPVLEILRGTSPAGAPVPVRPFAGKNTLI